MERYGPQNNEQCASLCPYVARIRVFAWQKGIGWDAALTELEQRAANMYHMPITPKPTRPEVCEQQGALPDECRVWHLLLFVSEACGLSVYDYMKSVHAATLFDIEAPAAPVQTAAVKTKMTSDGERPAVQEVGGMSVRAEAVQQPSDSAAQESQDHPDEPQPVWKRWKLPRWDMSWVQTAKGKLRAAWMAARQKVDILVPQGRARQFMLAFGITALVIAVLAAVGVAYWLGYRASVRENGTYENGYQAAISEKGTYESGYAAALEENGTYSEGYEKGYVEGKVDGYEAGRTEGYEEGLNDGLDSSQSASEPASAGETQAPATETVWVSRYLGWKYHSTPDCSRVIDPVEISLSQAEEEGYTRCSKCY